jgi:hypothetical protein
MAGPAAWHKADAKFGAKSGAKGGAKSGCGQDRTTPEAAFSQRFTTFTGYGLRIFPPEGFSIL